MRKITSIYILFLFLCLFETQASPKEPEGLHPTYSISELHMDHWTYRDGLVSNNINSIYQSNDHYIWLTSYSGLQKFDGIDFTNYTSHNVPSLKSSTVYKIIEDSHNQTWVTTKASGLIKYIKGQFSSYAHNNLIPKAIISMIEASNGDIWIGSDNDGLYVKKPNNSITKVQTIPETRILDLLEDRQGNIWVGTQGKGLFQIKGEKTTRFGLEDGLSSEVILTLHQASNRDIYIGTLSGLSVLRNGKIIRKKAFDGYEINKTIMDKHGSLWVATGEGLIRENERLGIFEFFSQEHGLPGIRVTALCFDHEGSLWVGMYNSGMVRFRVGQIKSLTTEKGLSFNKVNIIERHENTFFVGTEDGNTNLLKDKNLDFTLSDLDKTRSGIRDYLFDNSGDMWVASYDGVTRYTKNKKVVYNLDNGLPANDARRVFQASDSSIWIGTKSAGLIKFDESGNHTAYNKGNGMESDYVLSIEEDQKGNLIIGTNAGGLVIIDSIGNAQTKSFMEDNSELLIFNTHIDESNNIWLCTNAGIYLFDQGKFQKIKFKSKLRAPKFFDVIDDKIGGFWFTTDFGIVRVKQQDLLDFVAGEIDSVSARVYNESDGMSTRECTGATRSFFDDETGNIWVPTFGGVIVIDPKLDITNDVIPKVHITSLKVDSQHVSVHDDNIEIVPGANRLTFGFTSMSYLSPDQIEFKYKLEGLDEKWKTPTANRTVEYTNLPNGEYTFKVIGSNGHGMWNEQGASLSIDVLPFYYETAWFYILVICAISLILLALYKWRVNDIKQTNRALVKINKELDNFVYRASHDLRSPVTSTMGLVNIALRERSAEDKDTYFKLIDECAHKLDQVILDIIEYSKNKNERIKYSKFSVNDLVSEVLEELKFFDHLDKIHFEKNITKDVIRGDEFRIKIILSNLLINAVQYADLNKNEPKVNITVDQSRSNTRISIEDNGQGIASSEFDKIFKMFYRGNDRSKGSGLGLYIVKETADKLSGVVAMSSELGKGSVFELNIPRMSSVS